MEIRAPIGIVLTLVFLATELIVNPFFEIFKNKIIIARLRKLLAGGATISLGPENAFLNKFGLSTGVKSSDIALFLLKVLKIVVKFYVICVIAWWESGLKQEQITTNETSVFTRDAWRTTNGSVSFASVTPHLSLSEDAIQSLPELDVFADTNDANYTKSRNTNLELTYFTECVRDDVNNDGLRTAYFAVLRRNEDFTDAVCLNGDNGRDETPLLSFDPNNENKRNATVASINLRRYIATDFSSILFEGTVVTTDEFLGNRQFEGYITLTTFSHFRNGVGWYLYGFVMGPDDEMLRVIIVASTGVDDPKPCSGDTCLGNWTFDLNGATLPNGQSVGEFNPRLYSNQLESIRLRLGTVSEQDQGRQKYIALAWLAETSFQTFKSNERFIDDVMDRLSSDVFYFSNMGESEKVLRAFNTQEVTEVTNFITPFVISAIVLLLGFAVVGAVTEYRSRRTHGIASDILSREALVMVHKTDVFGYAGTWKNRKEAGTVGVFLRDGRNTLGFLDLNTGREISIHDRSSWDVSQIRLGIDDV